LRPDLQEELSEDSRRWIEGNEPAECCPWVADMGWSERLDASWLA
jgi:hypothetical protein